MASRVQENYTTTYHQNQLSIELYPQIVPNKLQACLEWTFFATTPNYLIAYKWSLRRVFSGGLLYAEISE